MVYINSIFIVTNQKFKWITKQFPKLKIDQYDFLILSLSDIKWV